MTGVECSSARTLIGRRINNYEIRALLGEGGKGAVYLAEHPPDCSGGRCRLVPVPATCP